MVVRFRAAVGSVEVIKVDDVGSTGTCNQLGIDWVLREGFDERGEPWPLTGSLRVVEQAGGETDVVAVVENRTNESQVLPNCALRWLPVFYGGGGCVGGPEDTLSPGESVELSVNPQIAGGAAGESHTFAIRGVSAQVTVVDAVPLER